MKSIFILLLTVITGILTSCSGSSEAKTRKEQEAEFKNAFGFSPPLTIVSIEYFDRYNRGVMDGGYGQWMSFTYNEESYRKIVANGYVSAGSTSFPNGDAAPDWWPEAVTSDSSLFSRSHDDTPVDEGFSFREYLWYDESEGKVFFHKSYWD